MPDWENDDITIHYEEAGSGFPILLFAPGGMRSAVEFWGRMPWNPIDVLCADFRVIAMDQRNAGRSRAPITGSDGWRDYAADQLGLLDALGIQRCHVLGCCIGGPYAFGLMQADPERVVAAVLQQPIGDSGENREAFYAMFDDWAAELRPDRPGVSEADWASFRSNMYDGDFVFNVSRDFVRGLPNPLLVLLGSDLYHPETISREVAAIAPDAELIEDWKEGEAAAASAERVLAFLHQHTP
jgi:pimeloyl-ACP methyl ester carboxylesterase